MSHRVIGLGGAVATIVGFVIGVSVFVLPGTLAGSVGPGVVLTYAIASVLGCFACVVGAQVGVAYPQSGASFLAAADLLGSLWGFLLVWLVVGGSAVGLGLLAYGLADYLGSVVAVDRLLTALISIVLLAIVNLYGSRASTRLQEGFVIVFLAALFLFIFAGLPHIDTGALTPFLPNGWSPMFAAVLPAYFSYAGFLVIIELAGDVRRPERTIPIALLISFFPVLLTYSLVSLTLVGLVQWEVLADSSSPVAAAASIVLPAPLVTAISLTAVAAAASSINGILLGYSRDVSALADRGLFPSRLLGRAEWMAVDSAGVVPIAVLALVAVLLGDGIETLAVQTVVGLLLVQCILGAALLRLPTTRADAYAALPFRLPLPVLRFFSGGLVLISAGACLAILLLQPQQLLVALAYAVTGVGVYRWRLRGRSSVDDAPTPAAR